MKKILLPSAVLVAGIMTAWSVGHFAFQPPKTIHASAQWKNVYRTQSGLVAGADLIVMAEHSFAQPGRLIGEGDEALPFTNNTFKIEKILKGEYEGTELVIEQTGGIMANGTVYNIDDGGAYLPGARYLLFLKSNEVGAFYVINHQSRYRMIGESLEGVDPTDNVVASFHRANFIEAGERIRKRAETFR